MKPEAPEKFLTTARQDALRNAVQLTAAPGAAAVAAAVFSSVSADGASTAIGVGLAAAVGAGVGAWLQRTPEEEAPPPRPRRPQRQIGHEIAEFLPLSLFVLDQRGRVTFANAVAQAEFGDAPIDRHYTLVLRAPALAQAVAEAGEARDARLSGAAISDAPVAGAIETSFTIHGRQIRHYKAFVQSVPPEDDARWGDLGLDPDARPAATLLMIQDVTRARRADKLHRDFVANASHELRTPLTSISGFIETLQTSAKNDAAAQVRFLSIMSEQSARMIQLVEDLLSLNRIELNEHVAPRERVDLREVVSAAEKTARGDLPADDPRRNGRCCDIELGGAASMVRGDAKELALALSNLVSNALKYGDENRPPRITISRREGEQPMIGVTVEDFGAGIAKDYIPRLCERFYRADNSVTQGKPGSGLGLAIVKHVVLRHRGDLDIESELGRGSRFTIWLNEAKAVFRRSDADLSQFSPE